MTNAQASPAGNPTLRTIVVVGLALVLMMADCTNLRRLWAPLGVFGYGTNLDGIVTGVTEGSPADAAGVRVGDGVDESAMTVQQRWELVQIAIVQSPGVTRTLGVFHDGARKTVTLTSVPEPMGPDSRTVLVLGLLGALIFIGIGTAVVLLRPTTATWGFYFFCLGYAPQQNNWFENAVHAPLVVWMDIALGTLVAGGLVGLLVFALHFLQASLSGWRRIAELAAPVIFVVLVALSAAQDEYTYFLGWPAEWIAHLNVGVQAVGALLVVAALTDTLVHQRGADRQRIRWVVFGFAVTVLCQLAITVLETEATNAPTEVRGAVSLVGCTATLAVAYAILKHRVIDVNFVVSRTLVYAVLTSVFVGAFALIDWFVGRVLDQTRWALVAEIAVAIGVGFWLNGLHARVDRFVDAVLFRRRHAAERRLTRLMHGLPHATSVGMVDASLLAEPRDALELTSAALFRRDGTGCYRRVASFEWNEGTTARLADDDPLILHLQAERGAIRLAELHWSRDDAPSGAARPALALPIIVRHELDAIALFGAHRGGEEFDPDELQWLNALSLAAGAAYDHLEADALRRQLEEVTRERDSIRASLREPGMLPTT